MILLSPAVENTGDNFIPQTQNLLISIIKVHKYNQFF